MWRQEGYGGYVCQGKVGWQTYWEHYRFQLVHVRLLEMSHARQPPNLLTARNTETSKISRMSLEILRYQNFHIKHLHFFRVMMLGLCFVCFSIFLHVTDRICNLDVWNRRKSFQALIFTDIFCNDIEMLWIICKIKAAFSRCL